MKYLSIDYGTKRIGIAISDDDGKIAFPKTVLENNSKIIENIKKIVKTEAVGKIVMGESKNFKMEDNEIMSEISDLKKVLETELEVDVDLHPEFLTSVEAVKMMAENSTEKNSVDASAAAIILQSYLDLKNKNIKIN